jgi:serine/threonine-protein kinase RsbW/stage II sporulation protein AB (anti-sigma F factor)
MTSGAASTVRAIGRGHFTGTYPAVPDVVPMLRRALAELAADAGAAREQVDAVRLVVSEAVTNVVLHAYPDRLGPVHVSADLAGAELWVIVADDGRGLCPGADSRGLGMGLALIADLSDDFAIVTRSSGGIEVRMRFNVDVGPSRPHGGQPRGSDASARTAAGPVFSTIT